MIDSEYHPLPQPAEITNRQKEDAMGAYLMMFAALGAGLPLPFINLVAAIIYYYVNKNKGRFVRFHLVQSLWSQIPVTLLNGFMVIYTIQMYISNKEFDKMYLSLLIVAVVANVLYFIFSIIAAMRARQGKFYYFLFFGKLAYHQVFKVRMTVEEPTDYINQPPV